MTTASPTASKTNMTYELWLQLPLQRAVNIARLRSAARVMVPADFCAQILAHNPSDRRPLRGAGQLALPHVEARGAAAIACEPHPRPKRQDATMTPLGNTIAAAKRLGVDHSAGSRRPTSLEQALGARSFDRHREG